MNLGSKADKRIFIGLVVLIVLTIMLVIGIAFIQQPQPSSSRAQVEGLVSDIDTITEEPPEEKQTATPEVTSVVETATPTPEPTSIIQTTSTPAVTPISQVSGTPVPTSASAQASSATASAQTTSAPTATPGAAKSNQTTTAPAQSGSSTYATSTPVPTMAKTLPVTGIANLTILFFSVGLVVMILGLAL